MPLPLAHGGKHISSLSTSNLEIPLKEDEENPRIVHQCKCLATSSHPSQTYSSHIEVDTDWSVDLNLSATLQTTFYEVEVMAKNSSKENMMKKVIACIQVQVAPTAEPFSSRYRNSLHRVELDTNTTPISIKIATKAIIAKNYLVCLIASQIIVFQLRKPVKEPKNPIIPLPPYITKVPDEPTHKVPWQSIHKVVPVATKPRRVPNLIGILCFCNFEALGSSLLLAGSDQGSIILVTYRDPRLAGILYTLDTPIIGMNHVSMGKRGKLVCLNREGEVYFLESHALVGTRAEMVDFTVGTNRQHESYGNGVYPDEKEEVSTENQHHSQNGNLDLLEVSTEESNMLLINLIPTCNYHVSERYCAMTWIDAYRLALLPKAGSNAVARVLMVQDSSIKLIATLTIDTDMLTETRHALFSATPMAEFPSADIPYHVFYDRNSSCLLVSSYIDASESVIHPISCCWHWQSNAISLLIFSTLDNLKYSYISNLFVVPTVNGDMKLTHVHNSTRGWQKTIYQTAILSPHNTLVPSSSVREECPLLLGSNFIMLPFCFKTTALSSKEMEWRTIPLPDSYISSCGPPLLACIAKQDCCSISIASKTGLCILDVASASDKSSHIPAMNKWRRFDNLEESSFRVLAMCWWEARESENLLLTIIQTHQSERILSCWTRKNLSLNNQLIRSIDGIASPSSLGIPLPSTFTPMSMSIIDSNDKAVLLISDCVETIIIFQFQRSFSGDEFTINSSLALHGGVNPGVENVFLASASFQFDLALTANNFNLGEKVGVIGMVCHSKVTGAIALRGLLMEEQDVVSGSLAKLMLSDNLRDTKVWVLELFNGNIWCWFTHAESIFIMEHAAPLRPPVQIGTDKQNDFLGTISYLGDSTMWMLSSLHSHSQFLVGSIPFSMHGSLLKMGQEVIKPHSGATQQGETSLQHEIFSLGKTSLAIPAFLFSFLNHLLTPTCNEKHFKSTFLRDKAHFVSYLHAMNCNDPAFVTFRVLILRTLEIVVASKKEKYAFKQATDLFARIIDFIDDTLEPKAFASLLLSVARQVEPSCLEYFFPLPSSSTIFLTIEDLYLECVQRGSLTTPAATLPLLSTKLSALEESKKLFYHCILKLSSVELELSKVVFDVAQEERQLIRDLFRFANQLEQMDDAEFWSDSKLDVKIMPSIEEKQQGLVVSNPIQTPDSKSRFRFNILSPLICTARRRVNERAVYEAASTFIGSGFEEVEYSNVDITMTTSTVPVSLMFIMGKLLIKLCLEEKSGWKKSALIARLVLGGNVIDESGEGVLKWMQNVSLSSLAVASHRISQSQYYLDLSDSDEMEDVVTTCLVQCILAADKELSLSDSSWLLELIILSLSRLSPKEVFNQRIAPTLVLLSVVVGHVSRRMDDMVRDLKRKDSNLLLQCYEDAKSITKM